jgi:hypothetical protein
MEKLQTGDEKQRSEYFFGRGIRLDVKNITAFAVSLNRIFVESRATSDWLGGLANFDIRRMLEITRDVISSPHLPLEELLKAHLTGTALALNQWKIKAAIIKRKYDIYPVDEHAFVQNVYSLAAEIPTTPLLGIRILQLLRDAQLRLNDQEHAFAPISAINEHFNAMGVHARTLAPWLQALLRTGLLLDYDPTVKDVSDASRLEISPAGKVHLIWGSTDRDYVAFMKEVTPVRDKETYDQLREFYRAGYSEYWRDSLATFLDYLLEEDAHWCEIPDHRQFEGQKRVRRRLSLIRERLLSTRFTGHSHNAN